MPNVRTRSVVCALAGAVLLGCGGIDIVGDELAADVPPAIDVGVADDGGCPTVECEGAAVVFDQALCV